MLLCYFIANALDGQSCVDTVNVGQRGTNAASTSRQVVVPESDFSCNGRITGYLISLKETNSSGDYPIVQVWRRHHTNLQIYNIVNTLCALTESDISNMGDYYLGNVSCTENERIKFQSGDVLGYYHANEVRYRLWSTDTAGYTAYHRDRNSPLNTLNINANSVDETDNRQPLIQVMYGKINIVICIKVASLHITYLHSMHVAC